MFEKIKISTLFNAIFSILIFFNSNVLARGNWISSNLQGKGVISALIIDSDGMMYAGTLRLGMFLSRDQGSTWEQINHGLHPLEIRAISITQSGNVYIGTGNGHIFVSNNRGKEWTLSVSLPSEIHTMTVNSRDHLFVGCGKHGVFKLIDGETTFKQTNLRHVSVQSLTFSPDNELYAATNLGLFRSTDEGHLWQRVETPDIFVFSLAVSANSDLYAGAWGGKIYLSRDKGKNWKRFDLGPENSIIRAISISNKGRVIAGVCVGGLFLSEDRGNSWKSINAGLDDLSVRSIALGLNGDIFVGTTNGFVFRSIESDYSYLSLEINPFINHKNNKIE